MASDTPANRYRDVLYEALAGAGNAVREADLAREGSVLLQPGDAP
jgi:hypothetical protein